FYAGGQGLDVNGNLGGQIAFEAFVHQVQRGSDGDGGNGDADQQAHLLPKGCSADEVAGLQVLRSRPGDGGCGADHSADHECQDRVVRRGPAGYEENGASGHQSGDAHAADGIGGV